MNSKGETLSIVDSINECRNLLLHTLGKTWSESSDVYISNSEWSTLMIIYKQGQVTQSYLSKELKITRQATHKVIKNLMIKQVIYMLPAAHNKKEKYIKLTQLGEQSLKENERMKTELEEMIASKIGKEKIQILKDILASDWGI